MTKVRRQRELLSRLEDEMELVRGRREEVISKKEEFSLFGSQLFISGVFIQVARKLDEEQMRTMEAEVRIQSKSDLILAPLYQEILSQGNISQYIHCGGGNTSLQYNNFPERMGNTPPSDHEISQGRGFCISQSSGDVFLCSRQCTERIQYIPTLGSAVPYSHCLIITSSLGLRNA